MSETRLGDWAARLTRGLTSRGRAFALTPTLPPYPALQVREGARGGLAPQSELAKALRHYHRVSPPRSSFLQRIRHVDVVYRPTGPPTDRGDIRAVVDSDLVSAKWLHMPCSMPPLVSDITGPRAKERPGGVELCLGLCLASMFPKKHMPEQIIQSGHVDGGRKRGDLVLNTSNIWLPLLYLFPLCSAVATYVRAKSGGLFDQSGQPPGPAREAAPKIVDHCHQQVSPPRVDLSAGWA